MVLFFYIEKYSKRKAILTTLGGQRTRQRGGVDSAESKKQKFWVQTGQETQKIEVKTSDIYSHC